MSYNRQHGRSSASSPVGLANSEGAASSPGKQLRPPTRKISARGSADAPRVAAAVDMSLRAAGGKAKLGPPGVGTAASGSRRSSSSGGAGGGSSGTAVADKPKQRKKYAEIDVRTMMMAADAPTVSVGRDESVSADTPRPCRHDGLPDADDGCAETRLSVSSDDKTTALAAADGRGLIEDNASGNDWVVPSADGHHANQLAQCLDVTQQASVASDGAWARVSGGEEISSVDVAAGSVDNRFPLPLPRGWRQCEDDNGEIYYWHVRSGAVQRERPACVPGTAEESPAAEFVPDPNEWRDSSIPLITAPASSGKRSQSKSKSPAPRKELCSSEQQQDAKCADYLHQCEGHLMNLEESCVWERMQGSSADDADLKRSGHGLTMSADARAQELQRFPARSLGWQSLAEADLADAESSSRAINRCISELATGCRANEGAIYAEGKETYLDIQGTELCLTDPATGGVLSKQPVHSIRVWAISGQSPSDFAYVARDLGTRQLKCHVFRCEFAARRVTEALQAACSRAAAERKRHSGGAEHPGLTSSTLASPDGLPAACNMVFDVSRAGAASLPSPMEGPRKAIRCRYLGSTEVHRPSGIEVLNGAIEKVVHRSGDLTNGQDAVVVVSPSVVSILDARDEGIALAECRIRYLAFLGISSTDVKLCGFIMHTAEDEFVAHIFHCEPSAGAICKTIEAACKLRFQKCLDAQPDLDVTKMGAQTSAASAGKVLQDTVMKGVHNILSKMWPSRKA